MLELGQAERQPCRVFVTAELASLSGDGEYVQPLGMEPANRVRRRLTGDVIGHYRRRGGLAIAWEEGLGRQAVTGKTGQLQPAVVDPLQRCRSLVSRLARQDLDSVVAQQVV